VIKRISLPFRTDISTIMATVLILEDSKLQAELITKLVARAGWSALVARSQESALAALNETRVDLLLLDVYVGDTNNRGFGGEQRSRRQQYHVTKR